MKINLGTIELRKKLNIGDVRLGIKKIYPPLEKLSVKPTAEKQVFIPESYGFEEVEIEGVKSEKLHITPSTEEQTFKGLFGEVNVGKIDTEEKTAELNFENKKVVEVVPSHNKFITKVTIPKPASLVPENIKYNEVVCGVKGTLGKQGSYNVKAIDYDGTVIKEAMLNEGEIFELPELPTHAGLIAQGWSCSAEIIDNRVTVEDDDIIAGVMYKTESGASEFDIELTKITGLTVGISTSIYKTSVDWGDGTVDNTWSHTYSNYGKYTIKIYGMTNISSRLFNQDQSVPNYFVKAARLSESITSIGNGGLGYLSLLEYVTLSESIKTLSRSCLAESAKLVSIILPKNIETVIDSLSYNNFALETIVIPFGVIEIKPYAFSSNYNLKTIIYPSTVTKLNSNIHSYNDRLTSLKISNNLKSIAGNFCSNCNALAEIKIGDSVEIIEASAFYNSSSLKKVIFSSNLTTIKNSVFGYCRSPILYDFSKAKIVPMLENTGAFSYINGGTKMVVPDELYDEWIAATNWSNYADYIYKASEVA